MSTDIENPKNILVGVVLSPQVIAKIDEKRAIHGGTRQAVIIDALNSALFESC